MVFQNKRNAVEFGDFQTPLSLADSVVAVLSSLKINPKSIIEPTCGKGVFIEASLSGFSDVQYVLGVDVNYEYVQIAKSKFKNNVSIKPHVNIIHENFFDVDWKDKLQFMNDPLLIIGNPPWVTNSKLGTIGGTNLPKKSNFNNQSGINSITGKSNFDISEWMILKYFNWLNGRKGVIAVLCKTSVARKILISLWKDRYKIVSSRIYKIDSLRHFGVSVDACLFVLETGENINTSCYIFNSIESSSPSNILGYRNGFIVTNIIEFDRYRDLEGKDKNYTWRSGIKHDCSKIMELLIFHNNYKNGLGELLDIEEKFLFPLLKGSDIGNGRNVNRTMMVVTQRNVGEETSSISKYAPKTWKYLDENREFFNKRKSSIYKNKPSFSIFGVGNYSFSPWKIAISGFYKKLSFVKISPSISGKPFVFDDTVYFLPCWSEKEADFLYEILTSPQAMGFYNSMIHWDEKRPITISLLKRLNIEKLAEKLGRFKEYNEFIKQYDRKNIVTLEVSS
ncbi:SAM-dependent methyltransferase [Parasaccharibacter sp. TMW2.1885]|uniref:hypothetical protein n=1 Tax=Parasaccharibacter sp. TMW2.1885 TaxID=2039287 RepID=UPI00200B443C|nr:hypothetical protein [Parasaccharibacter sp. TMW2.1885]MCK8636384.1 SAM-dependent methyltransferase [Parasaccharibacter sp. TMW2.1885]